MNQAHPLPPFVHHALWAYDITTLDVQHDRALIITQLLNRGGADAVRWLRQTYGDIEIAAVVQQPARGRWFPHVLNFWATMYNLVIQPEVFHHAIIRVTTPR